LPFLPFFDVVLEGDRGRIPNSSCVARVGDLPFGVMGGKSGKKRQRDVAVLSDVGDMMASWGELHSLPGKPHWGKAAGHNGRRMG
jgi:hypothetical protein